TGRPTFPARSLAATSAPARADRNTGFVELLPIIAMRIGPLPGARASRPAAAGAAGAGPEARGLSGLHDDAASAHVHSAPTTGQICVSLQTKTYTLPRALIPPPARPCLLCRRRRRPCLLYHHEEVAGLDALAGADDDLPNQPGGGRLDDRLQLH